MCFTSITQRKAELQISSLVSLFSLVDLVLHKSTSEVTASEYSLLSELKFLEKQS